MGPSYRRAGAERPATRRMRTCELFRARREKLEMRRVTFPRVSHSALPSLPIGTAGAPLRTALQACISHPTVG